MALSRRAATRMSANIWPGFVDAVTSLLMVMTFLLTIFIVVQYVLREEISGQQSELDDLSMEVAGLERSLGSAERRAAELERQRNSLSNETQAQSAQIAELETELDAQRDRIAEREAEVETLTARRDEATATAADLKAEQAALSRALASARDEIDAQAEEARLAAARREALEALTARLRGESEDREQQIAALRSDLTEMEKARAVDAAAAEELSRKLQNSEAELTTLSLAMEEERRRAEETLTLLAAADAAKADLTNRLAEALADVEAVNEAQDSTETLLEAALATNAELTSELAQISEALEAARAAKIAFQGDLEDARSELDAAETEVARLRAEAGREADERDRLAAALEEARAEAAALDGARDTQADLREQLEEALSLKLAAENRAAEMGNERDRQAALLEQARSELSGEEKANLDAQREIASLNAQLGALRRDVSTLQSLLDVAETDAEDSDIEIETLGRRLNAALMREAEEQKRRAELEAAERERLESYQSEFFGRMREILGNREQVEIVGDRFVFDSEVLFPSGSAQLSEEGREQVARVAALLDDVSDEIPDGIDWVIRVDGHTDDVPISNTSRFADNWELSQARALSVVRFMADDLGFPEDRLAPTGFGEFRPVDPADTPEARARNRRIELKLTER